MADAEIFTNVSTLTNYDSTIMAYGKPSSYGQFISYLNAVLDLKIMIMNSFNKIQQAFMVTNSIEVAHVAGYLESWSLDVSVKKVL